MLQLALILLAAATLWSILKAPPALKGVAVIAFIAPSAVGALLGTYVIKTNMEGGQVYYSIAGAIGGWMVGALYFDHRRKKLLAEQAKQQAAQAPGTPPT